MQILVSVIGLISLAGIAFLVSEQKRKIPLRIVLFGFFLQLLLAVCIFGIPDLGIKGPLRPVFSFANNLVIALLAYTEEGSRFLFGSLLDVNKAGFIFAFQVLPTIIFMASIMAVLYHLGVMQKIVQWIAILMQKTLRTSGAESLSVAANIFFGQTEAPLVVKPYVAKMTRSELFAVMVGGMATVAGGVLAAYVGLLKDRIPEIAGHLLTASVMSAPAALVIAKMIIPEREKPETAGSIPKQDVMEKDQNVIEAAARGAGEGLTLALNVAAMLLAFIALIACVDGILGWAGEVAGFSQWGPELLPLSLKEGETAKLSLSLIFGWIFSPMAWLMGVPWHEAPLAGSLLGEKIVVNEFVAYLHMSELMDQLSNRTVIILSYALCGFANFSSIAIQIGGIGGIAPERRKDLAALGIKSVIGGSLAAFMTATIAGLFI